MVLDTSCCIELLRERSRGTRGPATEKLKSLTQPVLTRNTSDFDRIPGLRVESC